MRGRTLASDREGGCARRLFHSLISIPPLTFGRQNMGIIVQTFTVDPAFLQEIKEDDRRLKLVLERFRRLVFNRDLAESNLPLVVVLVPVVRDCLAFHFALEEAFGYFEDPIAIAPRLCERVATLRAEHGELYADIATIADMLEDWETGTTVDFRTIRDACQAFLRRYDLHEAAENALMVRAFNEDVGVGD